MKETKEALELVLRGAEAVEKAMKDGKINFMDFPTFVPVFSLLGDAIEGIKEIPAELAGLDEENKKELYALIETLKLSDEKADEIAEEGLKVLLSVLKLVKLIKDARAK